MLIHLAYYVFGIIVGTVIESEQKDKTFGSWFLIALAIIGVVAACTIDLVMRVAGFA